VPCASQTAFGVTLAGEWSTGFNDCGFFLKGVGVTPAYGGDCTLWENSAPWNATLKAGLRQLALAQMDAFPDWFFWTWKVCRFIVQRNNHTDILLSNRRLVPHQVALSVHLFGRTNTVLKWDIFPLILETLSAYALR